MREKVKVGVFLRFTCCTVLRHRFFGEVSWDLNAQMRSNKYSLTPYNCFFFCGWNRGLKFLMRAPSPQKQAFFTRENLTAAVLNELPFILWNTLSEWGNDSQMPVARQSRWPVTGYFLCKLNRMYAISEKGS